MTPNAPSSEATKRDAAIQRTIDGFERARMRGETLGRVFDRAPTPSHVGRFELRCPLGQGAMGVVYEAFDPVLARDVALKLLFHGTRGSDDAFLREARALAAIAHPNVLPVYDAGVHAGVPYVVSALGTGSTLRTWLRGTETEGAPRPLSARVALLTGVARGLAAAHAAGLVHRDLKPENVLVIGAAEPRSLLGDFSLHEGREIPFRALLASASTDASDHAVGTLCYLSPEQLRGEPADDRSDQFGFCAMAFEVLFGVLPFGDRQGQALLDAIAAERTTRISARHPASALLPVLQRGLRDLPSTRHGSMSELTEAWEREIQRPRRLGLGLGIVALASLIAIVIVGALAASARSVPVPAEARTARSLSSAAP